MKTLFFVISFTLISIITDAQSLNINDLTIKDSTLFYHSQTYTGYFSSFHKNGKIKNYGYIKNGKIDSILTTYDKLGFPLLISRLENGKIIHQTIFYSKTNNIKSRISIKDKKENGKCTNYYPDGLLQDSGYYDMGKRIGKWTYWNKKGQKNYEITIHNDCWERTDYIYSNDSTISKTEFFDKYGRKIKK